MKNDLKSEIQLKEVTVYQNSASFKMIGKYHCRAGENEIVIDHLLNKMDKDSVRVKGVGPGKLVNIIIEKSKPMMMRHKKNWKIFRTNPGKCGTGKWK